MRKNETIKRAGVGTTAQIGRQVAGSAGNHATPTITPLVHR